MLNSRFFMPLTEGYHPNYRAILQRGSELAYAVPTKPISRALNKFMVDMVNNPLVFLELDCLWVYVSDAGSQFSTLNWINPLVNQNILVNSPAWTSKKGFESNGTTSYINSSYNPATQAVKYTLNSASIGAFVTDTTTLVPGTNMLMASQSGSNNIFLGRNSFNNSRIASRINDDSSDLVFQVQSQFLQNTLYSSSRTSSTHLTAYVNGAFFADTVAKTSQSIPSLNPYILARNTSGSPTFYMQPGVRIGMVFFGSGNLDHLSLYTYFNNLLSAL